MMHFQTTTAAWLLALAAIGAQFSALANAQTSCTTFLQSPPPTTVACGVGGTLKSPDPIATATKIPRSNKDPLSACRDSCLQTAGCVSFSYTQSGRSCQLYGQSLAKQGLGGRQSPNGIVYYAARCFSSSCTTTMPSSTTTTTSSTSSTSHTAIISPPPPPPDSTTLPTTTTTTTTTTSAASSTSVHPPSCTNVFVSDVGCYLNYYAGSGFLENPNNPGNTDGMPQMSTDSTDSSSAVCAAAQTCANLNNSTDPYFSFALYYINGGWTCVRYLGINEDGMGPPAQWFNVSDADVQQGYGYDLYRGCLNK